MSSAVFSMLFWPLMGENKSAYQQYSEKKFLLFYRFSFYFFTKYF